MGHAGKALGPLKSPETYEWEVNQCDEHMLLMCCDGFFSKNAFKSTKHLVEFLVNPMDYCHRSDFFSGERELAAVTVRVRRAHACPASVSIICESRNVCGGLSERASLAAPGSCQVQYGAFVQVHLHKRQRQGSLPVHKAGDSHAHT